MSVLLKVYFTESMHWYGNVGLQGNVMLLVRKSFYCFKIKPKQP